MSQHSGKVSGSEVEQSSDVHDEADQMIRWQTLSQRNSEFKSFFILNRDESFACRVRHSWIDLLIIACFDHKSITVVSDWKVFSDKLLGGRKPRSHPRATMKGKD